MVNVTGFLERRCCLDDTPETRSRLGGEGLVTSTRSSNQTATFRIPPTHAEDIVADAFLVAWRRFDDLPADVGDARAWLFGIALRTLLKASAATGVARP